MSLVNLSHVCSHLQNASVARLGLTSIPYTRLHLSLALLLHKQGFLSQVKLGGPSPPASAFPATIPDNHHVTSAPHRDRSPRSGEAALHDVVYGGKTQQDLMREGFGAEAIEFAMEHRELTAAQLTEDGWDAKAVDFVLEHAGKTREQMEADGFDSDAIRITETYSVEPALAEVGARLAHTGQSHVKLPPAQLTQRLRAQLRKNGFDKPTLQYFAGPARFATPRHLEQQGITLSAMGLSFPNQPVATLPPAYRDPNLLESEEQVTQSNRATRRLWLGLKYYDGLPVLTKARMLSKPTKRIWLASHELGRVVRGSQAGEIKGLRQVGELMAVSTDRGVMEARECVERRIGGMVLCRVW